MSGHLGCSLDVGLGKSVELVLRVNGHVGVVGLVQQVLAELGLQCADLGVEFAQLVLLLLVEFCTTFGKRLVGLLEHRHLLVVQNLLFHLGLLNAHLVVFVIDRFDACKELRIEVDAIGVGGQHR